jgi:hypothetical protein
MMYDLLLQISANAIHSAGHVYDLTAGDLRKALTFNNYSVAFKMENTILLIIAVFVGFVIYKALIAISKVLPESGFRDFMLSDYGKVFTGLMSLAVLYVGFVYLMMLSGVHC